MWWTRALVIVAVVASAAACTRTPDARQYEVHGQILGVDRDRQEVLVRHEDIKGFMPAMTMPYRVNDPALLDGKQPGDLFTATLVVEDVRAYLSTLTTTGHAPLEAPPAGPLITDADLLKEGEVVPDHALVDHTGTPRPLSSLRGGRIALTFMYTRCPLPDFCPLMDKHFAAVQQEIRTSPDLSDVRLVSVTLDPDYDVPAVLERHAKALGAERGRWYFLTGKPDDVLAFAKRFGVTAQSGDPDIGLVHNLRTAVIDAHGRLVTAYSGNTWTPAELVADLRKAPAPAH
ncbi:MAG: SCO family protein [Acidobacteria bacterium]|nr:SCO family protein [Acidobacteriota bacterium]